MRQSHDAGAPGAVAMLASSARNVLALIAMAIAASPSSSISQSRFEVYQLAPESPLASDGVSVFGVATDQRTLLVSSGAGSDWRVLTRRPSRISGLTWDRGVLYLAEAQTRAVFRLPLDRAPNSPLGPAPIPESSVERLQHDALKQPQDLAFAFGLFVSDPGADTVMRIDPATHKTEAFFRLPLADGLEVAADQRTVTIAATRIGEIHQTLSPPLDRKSVV